MVTTILLFSRGAEQFTRHNNCIVLGITNSFSHISVLTLHHGNYYCRIKTTYYLNGQYVYCTWANNTDYWFETVQKCFKVTNYFRVQYGFVLNYFELHFVTDTGGKTFFYLVENIGHIVIYYYDFYDHTIRIIHFEHTKWNGIILNCIYDY